MKKLLSAVIAIVAMTLVTLSSCVNKQPQVIIVKDTVRVPAQAEPVAQAAPAQTTQAAPEPKHHSEPTGPSQLQETAEDAAPAESVREHWTGAIGGKYKINMYINYDSGDFWYNYTSHPNGRMDLRVYESDGSHLVLIETDKYGEDTGEFDGYISGNTYSGTFTNYPHNKSYSFTLRRTN